MAQISRNILIAASAALLLGACAPGDNSAAQTAGPAVEEQSGGYLSEVSFDTDGPGAVIGNPDAAVTLIEYASLSCGHCKTFHESVIPTIKRDYVASGKVKLIYRDFPTDPDIAVIGAALARCAGPEGYFAAIDDFFANQAEIFTGVQEGRGHDVLKAFGERNGTPQDEYETCINSPDIRRALGKSVDAGRASGVNSTPSLFLNGEALKTGESRTAEGLSAIIDAALGEPAAAETTE
ncbi:MAG: DsbA family protein [Hyphomonadaceae bacterium]